MEEKRAAVMILAYGVWGLAVRSALSRDGYEEYLTVCAQKIRALKVDRYQVTVIFCGGAMVGNVTEAESLARYFEVPIRKQEFEFYLEDRSLTTEANVWQGFLKIVDNLEKTMERKFDLVLILCDRVRQRLVWWLVKKFDYKISRDRIQVEGIIRPDDNPKSRPWIQLIRLLTLMTHPKLLKQRKQMLRELPSSSP